MRQIAPLTALQYAPHLDVAINYARILGRLRKIVPTFCPSRNKAKRLKLRLHRNLGR